MAEELYFLKLDAEKAKIELTKKLNIDDQFSYQKSINKYSDEKLTFEEIIRKINSNIDLLSLEEFWSIYNWFYERSVLINPNSGYNEQKKLLINSMSANGIELFYEIPSKTPVRQFHRILGDYEYHIQTDIDFKCNSKEFDNFLNYAICFTGELSIFLNENYYKEKFDYEENINIRKTIDNINSKYGETYRKLALKQYKEDFEYNSETIKKSHPLIEFRKQTMNLPIVEYPIEFTGISNKESELLSLAGCYDIFTNIKKIIENYSGTILRLHSY